MDKHHPSANATLKQQVMQLCQGNRMHDARTLCLKLCQSSPNDAECWFLLGAINGALFRYDEAASAKLHA